MIGNLLYAVSTSLPEESWTHRKTLVDYIVSKKIANMAQLEAAFKYFKTKDNFEKELFEKSCGVGVVYTNEQIIEKVTAAIKAHEAELKADRFDSVIIAL